MTKLEDIEKAISQLAPADLERLRRWFTERDAELFDKAIEHDAKSGKLDGLRAEVRDNHKAGRGEEF